MKYDEDPFAIPLVSEDISALGFFTLDDAMFGFLGFPNGNHGDGVFVERRDEKWHLSAGTDEWRGQGEDRRNAQTLGEALIQSAPCATPDPVDLDGVVLSPHPAGRWTVVGHWNLARAWRLRATEDWPFGGTRLPLSTIETMAAGMEPAPKLLACLPDGGLFVPRIPSFAEAEAWIVSRDLTVPETQCNCGEVHWGAGRVVGLHIGPFFHSVVVNLIVQESGRCHFYGKCPEHILDLQACVLLGCVELGGMAPREWMRMQEDES